MTSKMLELLEQAEELPERADMAAIAAAAVVARSNKLLTGWADTDSVEDARTAAAEHAKDAQTAADRTREITTEAVAALKSWARRL